jgi:hypothetical protein
MNPRFHSVAIGLGKIGPGATTRTGPPSLRDARDYNLLPGTMGKRGQTPSDDRDMLDSRAMEAERGLQPAFMKNIV